MRRTKVFTGMILVLGLLFLNLGISGCLVRTYSVEKPRVDQDLSGNQGFIQGNIPAASKQEVTKKTRKVNVVEIELRPPIKFEKGLPPSKVAETTEDTEIWGNRGYVEYSPAAGEKKVKRLRRLREESAEDAEEDVILYTVQKGDTLQKISMKFFGTTRKFLKICKDNKDKLKNCEKIYPGQVLKILK